MSITHPTSLMRSGPNPRRIMVQIYSLITIYNLFHFLYAAKTIHVSNKITWIIIFSQEYIIVYALGANIPYLSFLLIFPVANIAGYIPVTFAGIGFRELTSIIIFSRMFGTDEEVILVFTLIGFIIIDLFLGFVGFLVSLTETGRTDVADFKKILSK